MSKRIQRNQNALVEACKKAGIDVTFYETTAPSTEIILKDDCGRRYKVGKDLEINPVCKSASKPQIRVYDVNGLRVGVKKVSTIIPDAACVKVSPSKGVVFKVGKSRCRIGKVARKQKGKPNIIDF